MSEPQAEEAPDADPHDRARELVRKARAGDFGQDGADWLALLEAAHHRGQDAELLSASERQKREGLEREANAMAAVLADILDEMAKLGVLATANLDEAVAPLPADARRRILAYRHRLHPLGGIPARDQLGPLPHVPPRASVLRESARTIDVTPATD